MKRIKVLSQRERAVRRRSFRRSRGIHFRVSDTWVLGGAQVSYLQEIAVAPEDWRPRGVLLLLELLCYCLFCLLLLQEIQCECENQKKT